MTPIPTTPVEAPARAVDIPGQRGPAATWPIVERAKLGDRDAFAELFVLYRGDVARFVRSRLRHSDPQLVEDITSDTWVRAIRGVGTIEWRGRDFGAWLLTIARNLIADHYKSGWARRQVVAGPAGMWGYRDGEDGEEPPSPDPDIVDVVIALVDLPRADLVAAMRVLTDQQREVVRLRFVLGLNVAETAENLGQTVGAVKALQLRAVRALARGMGVQRP